MGIKRLQPRRVIIPSTIFLRLKDLQLLKPFRAKKQHCYNHGYDNTLPVRITSRFTENSKDPHIVDNRNISSYKAITHSNLICIQTTPNTFYSKAMNVGYLNARSVRNKAEDICDFICENDLDICTITETWLNKSDDKDKVVTGDLTPAGYDLLHVPRAKGKGGGVAVILKSTIKTTMDKKRRFKSLNQWKCYVN